MNAGQEKHDFMLYALITTLIIVTTILTLAGFKLPDLDLSEPVPHKVLVTFELSLVAWILLYLPYKRHKAQEKDHEIQKRNIGEQQMAQLAQKNLQIKELEARLEEKLTREQKAKLLHDSLLKLETQTRGWGAKRHFDGPMPKARWIRTKLVAAARRA